MKLRPIFKDIILTFFTEISVLVSFFVLYRIIANNYGPDGVGEYSLARRLLSLFQSVLLMGIGVGIPRYIALSKTSEQRGAYVRSAGAALLILSLLFVIIINLFANQSAEILFGSEKYANFIFPFSLLVIGSASHSFAYSYLRGRLMSKKFNILQILNLSVVPLLLFWYLGDRPMNDVIGIVGIIMSAVSAIFILLFIKEIFIPIGHKTLVSHFKELFVYGMPRMAGDFLYAGLFSFGAIFAAHLLTMREVGYFSLSISLLNMVGSFVGPLGLILLPKISNLIAENKTDLIGEKLDYFIGAIIQMSIFASFQLIIFADTILDLWLGTGFSDAVIIMRIVFMTIAFYPFYVASTSILNASRKKPLDLINVSRALVFFLIFSGGLFIFRNSINVAIGLSVSFSSSLIFLSMLAYISVRGIYPRKNGNDFKYFIVAMLVNILLASIEIYLKPIITSEIYYFIIFEVMLGIFYLAVLWVLKAEWIRQTYRTMFIRASL